MQTYNAMPSSTTLQNTRPIIEDRTDTLRSSFSGSTAPATAVQGQLFVDSDDNIPYLCTNATGPVFNTLSSAMGISTFALTFLDDTSGSAVRTTIGAAGSGANTDITSVLLNQTGLVVKGGSSNALTIKPNETLSAGRTLNIVTGDADRTITLGGSPTINGGTHSGTNTGDQTITLTGDVTGSGTGSFAATVDKSYITGKTEDTSPDANADYVVTYDNSAATHKKVLLKNVKVIESFTIAVGDETTAITTGTAKVTFRMPYAFTITAVRASLNTVSSSGNPAIDINEGGVSIFSTTLTIDASEKTSTTAATAAVLSDTSLADDAEMTIDIDTAGTGAKGLKVTIIGYRT